MIELLYARVADLITESGTPCFIAEAKNVEPPYCIVWGQLPVERAFLAAGVDQQVNLDFNVQVVAKDPASVFLLSGEVKRVLQGAVIPAAGWRVFPLKVTGSTQIQIDRGAVEPLTNQYPAFLTLHVNIRASKEIRDGRTS